MSKVSNGVPIPPFKYPWKTMKPGQSFTVKTAEERNSGLKMARYADIPATSRKIKGGYRLWRTA
jgi:hypothetical protein